MQNKPNIGVIIALVVLILVAIVAIAYFLISSNAQSGTVEPVTQQMKASSRSKGHRTPNPNPGN